MTNEISQDNEDRAPLKRSDFLVPAGKAKPSNTKALVKSDPIQSYLNEISRYRLISFR